MEAWLESLPPEYVIAAFVPIFAVFLMAILRLLSFMSWEVRAEKYRATGDVPPDAMKYTRQSADFSTRLIFPVNYSNALNLWIDQQAIYLRPTFLFRVFHPLLRIPLADFSATETRVLWLKGCKLTFRNGQLPIKIYGRGGQAVIAAKAKTQTWSRV